MLKLVIYFPGKAPLEIDAERVRVYTQADHFELREAGSGGALQQGGLLVRLEEHQRRGPDGEIETWRLAMNLAVFPNGANGVRLKGGLE
jgi:hypothetical protein